MDRLRLLLRPRWIIGLLIVLIVAGICVRLGFWQLDRLEQRRAYNARVEAAMAAPPSALASLLPPGSTDPGEALAYRRATTTGRYDPEREVVLFGRSLDGAPGNHLLTPLVTEDAGTIIVDRGWIPLELDTPPVAEALPPTGVVQVTGFLLLPEADGPGTVSSGPAAEVNLDQIEASTGTELAPMYLRLETQEPGSGDLPRAAPLEPLGDGPHLGYAVQWFIFGGIALIGFAILARKELREEAEASDAD